MLKRLLIVTALAMSLNTLSAHPVDVNVAKDLGRKFVESNFAVSNRSLDLTLVHTSLTERNADCFYIFNVGNEGFIIISADDFYRPIIGYSENGGFDVNNVPPALADYLENIRAGRSVNTNLSSAAPDVAADWSMLEKTGRLVSRHGGRGVDYLVQTQWDQSYPYNCCCPEDPNGSGGHAIVGCLATAMSQLMRFWAYPAQGQGSHCYYHGDYGQICADFGATTYDWDNMPNKLNNSSSEAQKLATGTLCFHCGVTIDMGYGPDGSGGASGPIPGVMHTYFNYCDAIVQHRRDDFETEIWKSMVREQFDMGWPMYYGGCEDDGCHAFVCDGYDDHDMFHFNLGWGGGSDGWYLIDDAPYTHPADAMFNFVPKPVYDATPSAPTALNVTVESDTSLDAVLTWTNPTTYLDGSALTSIEKIVVMRNNSVVYETTDNVMPGQQMTCTDHVPYYDNFSYQVYAVSGQRNGKQVMYRGAQFGPSCDWKFVLSASSYYGWEGCYISVYNSAGTEIAQVTTTSSTPAAVHVDMPIGRLSFGWTAADTTEVSFSIKDAQNNTLYSYSGSSVELSNGIFFTANNGCGNDAPAGSVGGLVAWSHDGDITVYWNSINQEGYGYNLYRDGKLIALTSDTQYEDVAPEIGGHCYQVAYLGDGGESELSEEECATAGEGCDAGSSLWYSLQNNFKPVIYWTAPSNTNGRLTGYYIYRKTDDTDYQLIKLVGPSKTEYKEMQSLEDNTWYSYRVMAYYQDIDCISAPFRSIYGDFYVRVLYSTDGLGENLDNSMEIYPNPVRDILTVKAENISDVVVYNTLGQKVFAGSFDTSEVSINLEQFDSGIYLVKVIADGKEMTQKISVIKH